MLLLLLLQEEGLQAFTQYLRKLTAQRAQDSYSSLVEGGAHTPLQASQFGTQAPHSHRHVCTEVEFRQRTSLVVSPWTREHVVCVLSRAA